jgi:hypothetical protein
MEGWTRVRVDRNYLNWGLFLIILGAIPLLVHQGALDRQVLGDAWRLWPLIIIGIGVGIVLRRTPLAAAGGLIVAATFAVLLGSVLAVGPGITIGCGAAGSGSTLTTSDRGAFEGQAGSVRIRFDCGTLRVNTASGNGWSVDAKDPPGGPVLIDHGGGQLNLSSTGDVDSFAAFFSGQAGREWNVTLPTDPGIGFRAEMNAGSATLDLGNGNWSRVETTFNAADVRIDLSGSRLGSLRMEYNAGSARVTLPGGNSFNGTIKSNASSLALCVPTDVGFRMAVSGALNSVNVYGADLTRADDTWTSAGYGSATNRINLEIDANAASVEVNPKGGCR